VKKIIQNFPGYHLLPFCIAASLTFSFAAEQNLANGAEIKKDTRSKIVEHDAGVFRADPSYPEEEYDIEAQLQIYGGKSAYPVTRPLLEIGNPLYSGGPLVEGGDALGELNPTFTELYVYGDWRSALAFNDNGNVEVGQVATRLNLDIDYKFTGTERIHAILRPLDGQGEFSRCEFFGDDAPNNDPNKKCDAQIDGNLDALFFEGDAGALYAGFSGEYSSLDVPFSLGLMPLLFQNGIWIEDAFTGVATAIPSLNSPLLDITNMDISFFYGFDKVTNQAFKDDQNANADHNVNIFGVATFVEAMEAYWEAGFARLDGEGGFDDESYNSATIAYTKRYGALLSNSIRAIWSFGQDRDNNLQDTADGLILLVENSLITSLPSTLVPYGNFFVGIDRPQSAARADGLLKNTGINFETDGLTGFPKLNDTGQNAFGGAIGVSYLFNLDRQIVIEAATNQVIEGENEVGRSLRGDEYALGLRYQQNINEAWLFRADAMHGWRTEEQNISGARFEIRRKF
tara:strand:- start:463 stop:2004 length:1542 start_codon:yes stop_codon:yes gene_type:complete